MYGIIGKQKGIKMITLTDIDKSLLAFHEWCVDSFGDEFIPSIDMIKAWQAAYLRSQDKIIELEHTIAMSEPLGWFHLDYPAERYGNLDEIEYDFGSTEGAYKYALSNSNKRIAELEKDAERYRWMRNNTSVMLFDQQTWVTSHKLDMRVDEAMKGSNDDN